MKAVSGKRFCQILKSKDWELKRINGSHHIYVKAGNTVRISVPVQTVESRIAKTPDEARRN